MATQYYLNKTGLTYFWGRIQALFVAKETGKGLSSNDYTNEDKAEVAKIAGLVATGGEPNVIETVKVNGTALTPDAQGAVDVRTATASVTATGTGADMAPGAAVINNAANDQHINITATANGYNLSLANENIAEPGTIQISKAIPDEARVNALIAAAVTAGVGEITGFEYEVVASLPTSGEKGVIYLAPNSGNAPNVKDEYIWINKGTAESPDYAFELLGTTELDLSGYLQSTDIEAITTAEIDAITGNTTPTP